MRQVKPREAAHGRKSSAPRRGKPAVKRVPEPRAAKRRGRDERAGFDPEAALERLRETFPFRHPMLTLTLALLCFGGLAGMVAGGHLTKTEARISEAVNGAVAGAGFAIRQVHLSGNERTTEDAAFTAVDVAQGRSIFAVDPAAARKRLLQLPWVSDAEVSRQFPDTVSIRLIEKRPFALWRNGTALSVIERNGSIITKDGAASFHLPVISGTGAPNSAAPFLDALGAFKAVNGRVRMIQRVGERRWDLLLDGNVTVRLPEIGWETQLAELEKLIGQNRLLERDIEIIDMRYPENYIFRLHNGDSRPMPRQQRA